MHRIIILFLFISFNNHAQIEGNLNEVYPVFPVCKLLPDNKQNQCFDESMYEHIEKNFKYPKTAWDLNLESQVRIRFNINQNGEVDNIKANAAVVGISFIEKEALKAAESMFEVAAANILRTLPKMIPAKITRPEIDRAISTGSKPSKITGNAYCKITPRILPKIPLNKPIKAT